MNTKKVKTKKVTKSEIKKQNISGSQKAKTASKIALVLGILFAVQLILEIIFQIVHTAKGHSSEDAFAKFFIYFRSGLGVAEIVLAILIWVNSKNIKQNSKANILLFVVGLPILFGVSEIIEFVVVVMTLSKTTITLAAGWAMQIILWLGLVGASTISFIGYAQIKNSIK